MRDNLEYELFNQHVVCHEIDTFSYVQSIIC